MSNRARIDRMRAEAEATKKEKDEKKSDAVKREPTAAGKRAIAGDTRMKVVWAVKDPRGEILKTYPYPRKDLAQAEADRMTAADQRTYIVTPEKVPM